jgi:hypothetical protein
MSSFDGIIKKIPSDLGVEIWQAVIDLGGLPDVTVTYDEYPSMTLSRETPGWVEHLEAQAAGIGTSGHYVFRQPVYYSHEQDDQHELRWPEFYLASFLAREAVEVPGGTWPVRNDKVFMEMLREQFLRCRNVPTFQNGDPVPGFSCCRKPLACERDQI